MGLNWVAKGRYRYRLHRLSQGSRLKSNAPLLGSPGKMHPPTIRFGGVFPISVVLEIPRRIVRSVVPACCLPNRGVCMLRSRPAPSIKLQIALRTAARETCLFCS